MTVDKMTVETVDKMTVQNDKTKMTVNKMIWYKNDCK